jgi:predicted DNA-binding transcriptional regulator YafY
MSTSALLNPAALAPTTAVVVNRPLQPARHAQSQKSLTPQHMLRVAMLDSDQWVIELEYADSKGKRTRRMVSPIRFSTPDRFLGLCLCREEPRQFYLNRCSNIRLIRSEDVMMPVEMVQLDR